MKPKVHLGIPYWGADPDRMRNFGYVMPLMAGGYTWTSSTFHIPETHHTRSRARNFIVRQAMEAGADIVVLCDADSYPDQSGLLNAIHTAYTMGGLNFAFDRFRGFNELGTQMLIGGHPLSAYNQLESECLGSLGGCMAIRPSQWADAGWSPDLSGWGFEDVIFAVQARTLLPRDNQWHEGWLSHLWHPKEVQPWSDQYKINKAICEEFERASWKPDEIRELIGKYNHDAGQPR